MLGETQTQAQKTISSSDEGKAPEAKTVELVEAKFVEVDSTSVEARLDAWE